MPGSISGAIGYRAELAGQKPRILRLATASVSGGIIGAVLLLSLPGSAFEAIVPVLIALALVLVVIQPRLSRALAERRTRDRPSGGPLLWTGVFGAGIYGGYFGAAQGIIVLAMTAIAIPEDLQRLNAMKNILTALVNGVAAVIFIFVATVAWLPALLLAVGSAAGGQIGARIGKRLSPTVLRGVIVVVGIAAIVQLTT